MARPTVTHDPRLLMLASILGMGAVILMPMTAVGRNGMSEHPVTRYALWSLFFALPLLLMVVARLRGHRWLMLGGAALLVLTGIATVSAPGPLAVVPPLIVLAGPVAAVILVGAPLRDVDVPAAAGFLMSASIAVIGGFAAAAAPGAAWLVIGVAVAGLVTVGYRLRRQLLVP